MEKQLIISIGREFGSGGHEIAEMLAEHFSIKLYDKSLLQDIAQEKQIDGKELERYDEKPRNKFLTRSLYGYSQSMEENLANMQFEFIKKRAEKGESFVVVGRCAETILKNQPALVSIFVLGDWESKIDRVVRLYHLTREEAESFINRQDSKRKHYHNYYCKGKWGDSRNYDIAVNSSKLGEKLTADLLAEYILQRQQHFS
ncbi:MAG: cytidylate kinase-like family protein [bacterium]|nr:cytidylate kinase-like family protein [bacterium]